MPISNEDFERLALNDQDGHPLQHQRRIHQKRAAWAIRNWATNHASEYATKEEAENACREAIASTFLTVLLMEVLNWLIQQIIAHFFPTT